MQSVQNQPLFPFCVTIERKRGISNFTLSVSTAVKKLERVELKNDLLSKRERKFSWINRPMLTMMTGAVLRMIQSWKDCCSLLFESDHSLDGWYFPAQHWSEKEGRFDFSSEENDEVSKFEGRSSSPKVKSYSSEK